MKKILFIISKGFEKAGGATRAFQFAKVAKEQGQDVNVFLVDDAVAWTQFGMADSARALTGEEMKPLIDYLLENEAGVIACKA